MLRITGKLNPLALIFAGPIHVVVERLVGKAAKKKKRKRVVAVEEGEAGKKGMSCVFNTRLKLDLIPRQCNGYLLFVVA